MNAIYLSPTNPKHGKPVMVCYEWDPVVIGATVNIDVFYKTDSTGSETLGPLACPTTGFACAMTNPVPDTAVTVTYTDSTGQAQQVSRVIV